MPEWLLELARILPGAVRPNLRRYPSAPFPERLSAQDTLTWREPIPPASGNFQTFWFGNQLPGSYMHLTPHTQYLVYKSQDFVQPQYNTQASFGPQMGQVSTAQLMANWRTLWASASSQYGSNG